MKSPHLDPVWLREQYEINGLSTYDIGRMVGRDPKCVYQKLRDFGIPTRPRGLNLAGAANYMRLGKGNPFAGHAHTAETRARLSAAATHPKPYLRGKRNGMSGRTGASNPNYVDGSSPERQRIYASAKWRALLRRVYKRDEYHCQCCCASKQGRRSLHAHHIVPWAGNPSLRFNPDNLVTLCRTCHEWVHSSANVDGLFLHNNPALRSSDST